MIIGGGGYGGGGPEGKNGIILSCAEVAGGGGTGTPSLYTGPGGALWKATQNKTGLQKLF